MFNLKIRQLIMLAITATLFFCQNALASTAMDSIGTGSTGSYSHGAGKSEGSKGKKTMPHHISGKKGHYKSEGSKSSGPQGKSKGHGYSHKKPEGSSGKHHARSGHGYSKGHKSGHGGHSSKCPFTHLLRFKDKLGLTEAQIAEVKRLRFEFGKQSVRNKAEHKIAHMEYDRVVHAEKVDAKAIRSAAMKIAESKTNKIMAKAEAKIALLNLLTEEQRKKAHKMYSSH